MLNIINKLKYLKWVGKEYYLVHALGILTYEWDNSEQDFKMLKENKIFWDFEEAKETLISYYPNFKGKI